MNYLPKLFTTGAIRETPKKVLEKVADEVVLYPGTTLVEAGAGWGEITRCLLDKKRPDTTLQYYAFEIDPDACQYLKEHFPDITVRSESAFDFDNSLSNAQLLDYFISSIPLSFYKKELIGAFLEKIKSRLKPGGKILIIFSAAWLLPVFKKHLQGLETQYFLTFPPYFMVVYTHAQAAGKQPRH